MNKHTLQNGTLGVLLGVVWVLITTSCPDTDSADPTERLRLK